MKKKYFLAFMCVVLALFVFAKAESFTLDDFSGYKVGNFPKRWRTWPLQRDKAAEVYSVAEEGGSKYIKAYDDHDVSTQIFYNFSWIVKDKPFLSWKWRATTLPIGAKESDDATNDSACGVYVIVGKYDGHAIKYVLSSSLPVGTVVSRHGGKLKIKVLDSANKGKWIKHSVNVIYDYKELFGGDLGKNPSGIALLTDGNAVHKPAGCDYADFAVSDK